jgi:hypothetical protein
VCRSDSIPRKPSARPPGASDVSTRHLAWNSRAWRRRGKAGELDPGSFRVDRFPPPKSAGATIGEQRRSAARCRLVGVGRICVEMLVQTAHYRVAQRLSLPKGARAGHHVTSPCIRGGAGWRRTHLRTDYAFLHMGAATEDVSPGFFRLAQRHDERRFIFRVSLL